MAGIRIQFSIGDGASLQAVTQVVGDLQLACAAAERIARQSELNNVGREVRRNVDSTLRSLREEQINYLRQYFDSEGSKASDAALWRFVRFSPLGNRILFDLDLYPVWDNQQEARLLLENADASAETGDDRVLRVSSISYNSPFQIVLDVADTVTAAGVFSVVSLLLGIYYKYPDRAKTRAETEKLSAEARKTDADTEKINAETRKIDAETNAIDRETALRAEIVHELLDQVASGRLNLSATEIENASTAELVSALARLASTRPEVFSTDIE